ASALSIAGCAQQGTEGALLKNGEKLTITKGVWTDYQEYVQHGRGLGPDRQGAFGVAIIGNLGVGSLYQYYYCPRQYDGCRPGRTAVTDVLDECRRNNLECLIFARNEDIQVPYEIEE
ncbi:MAG TPA: hypothetical protein VFZ03_08015, partial [Dongiaceae bacterium]